MRRAHFSPMVGKQACPMTADCHRLLHRSQTTFCQTRFLRQNPLGKRRGELIPKRICGHISSRGKCFESMRHMAEAIRCRPADLRTQNNRNFPGAKTPQNQMQKQATPHPLRHRRRISDFANRLSKCPFAEKPKRSCRGIKWKHPPLDLLEDRWNGIFALKERADFRSIVLLH